MADPFQPRFADLVRNYTSTSGTGNFVLGPAVNGFTGFGSALAVGESFYYSAIGVDKPAEREVGRGTLLSNGQISRDPITGPKTNFTNGTKSIALIAAAEWFERVDSGTGGGGSAASATRPQLAATPSSQAAMILTEAGREGLFVFDSSNLSAKVSADPNQCLYVPPTGGNGSTGAWVRKSSGALDEKWGGVTLDGTTNDAAAFNAVQSLRLALANPVYGYGYGTPKAAVPYGVSLLGGTTLDLYGTGVLAGEGSGLPGGGTSVLKFTGNTTGIRIQNHNTEGASTTVAANTHKSGAATIVEGMFLEGGYVATPGDYHAFHLRAPALLRDSYAEKFPGDGVFAHTQIGGGGALEGNANLTRVERMWVEQCRNGFYFEGADANAFSVTGCSANGCREYGFVDNSFLGGTWIANHASDCTLGAYHSSGANNAALFVGCYEEGSQPASTFSPKTLRIGGFWTNSGYNQGGGLIQAVNNRVTTNDLQVVGDLFVDDDAAVTGDLTAATLTVPAAFSVGALGNVAAYGNVHGFGPTSGAAADNSFTLNCTNVYNGFAFRSSGQLDGGLTTQRNAGMYVDGGASGTSLFFRPNGSAIAATMTPTALNLATGTVLQNNGTPIISGSGVLQAAAFPALTGNVTTSAGSLVATIANAAVTYAKIQNVAASRLLGNPTGGATAASEISLAGGLSFSGTALTAAGALTPTSVASTGAIKSSGTGGVGYATGAGASVTQLTSKSTAPPAINKDCGQVVTNNAALAAGALVSFTVSNSEVAATDTINLNLQSGNATAGAYRYWIDKVSAGSFVVALENRSGGSLSEALVFTFAVLKAVTT